MTRIIYNSSDDNPVKGVIYINDEIQPIPSDSTILAYVSDLDRVTKIINDITISEADDGNDWANGVIKGVFSKAASAALAAYDGQIVLVVVQATIDGHTESWTKPIEARKLL
jgi:hypothetical protein